MQSKIELEMQNYFNYLFFIITTIIIIASCSVPSDNFDLVNSTTYEYSLTGEITEDKTLSESTTWNLNGRVFVKNGATLTIPAGTIIKANQGTGSNAAVLIISRGAKIIAEGTADKPIIFTTQYDSITAGNFIGTNLNENSRGLWGGLIILGKAPIHGDKPTAGVTERNIEGLPANSLNGMYGGSIENDNSGILKYVSVRHGGVAIGEGNEINGITFGGVGNGTLVENIEVVGNVDDGVEFFGGTVNATNVLVWAQGDDAIDIDEAYKGTLKNVFVKLGIASDHALEVDGPKSGPNVNAQYTLSGATFVGYNAPAGRASIADFRDGAVGINSGILVKGFKAESNVELDASADVTRFTKGDLLFKNWKVKLPEGSTDINGIFDNKVSGDTFNNPVFATAITSESITVGADESVFGWTMYKKKGN